MRQFLLATYCLLVPPVVRTHAADPPAQTTPASVKITAPIDAPTSKPIPVSFTFVGDAVKWKISGDPVESFREFSDDPNVIKFRLFSDQPARVFFFAVASDKGALGEPQVGEVRIGTPKPPPPEDVFNKSIREAFASETEPDKALVSRLSALYREQSKNMAGITAGTWADVFKDMQSAAKTLGLTGHLKATQTVIAGELSKTLPPGNKALDDDGRKIGETVFLRMAQVLSELQ